MKRIHLQILRMFPGPFLGWLGTLIFLLVMQFLIRYLPDLVGKGLPLLVIGEIIIYNLAYMIVLAVPMAVLISNLMTFGRLAETNVYTVLKSSGVSVLQLIWPMMILGLVITAGMWQFNSEVLPAANFRASSLWKDIRRKQPGFELTPGVFYEGIDDYSILVREIPPESNTLIDVTIFDYSDKAVQQVLIKASRGHLETRDHGNRVDLVLEDGEMHRVLNPRGRVLEDRYERLAFHRHRLTFDLSEFSFERSNPDDGYRTDRTMRTADMVRYVDSLEASIADRGASLHKIGARWMLDSLYAPARPAPVLTADPLDTTLAYIGARRPLQGLTQLQVKQAYDGALGTLRADRSVIEQINRSIDSERQRADKYRVEIHKKYSIAVACIIFVLIGAPLGLSMKRGGLGIVGGMAVGIFLFYWVTLVQGEKLADRGMLIPWVGMWGANIVMSILGTGLLFYVLLDLKARPLFPRKA
ncbi:MAG: LptF/LptG family permease [Rhodothermales bacterium]